LVYKFQSEEKMKDLKGHDLGKSHVFTKICTEKYRQVRERWWLMELTDKGQCGINGDV
jgi:hypothetical protein